MVAFGEICVAATVMQLGIFGGERDCLIIIPNCMVVIILQIVHSGAIGVGDSKVRIEVNCFIVVPDGAVILTFKAVSTTAVVIELSNIGIELDCLVVIPNGVVEVALGRMINAAAVVPVGNQGIQRYRFIVVTQHCRLKYQTNDPEDFRRVCQKI